MWAQTTNLQNDTYLKTLGDESCDTADWHKIKSNCVKHHSGTKFSLLSCLIDNGNSDLTVQCGQFIQRIEVIAFSDFRLVSQFTSSCNDDVMRFQCGRMAPDKFVSYTFFI